MLRRSLVLLTLAVSAASCQKPKCRGELDRDDLRRLQKLTEDGKDPCPEHLHPSISAGKDGVKLGDRLLVREAPPDGRVLRLDALFRELKENREIWKQLHPGDRFMAEPVVRIDPACSAALGASTLASVAFSGYPKIHLVSGAFELDFDYAVPGPPRPDAPMPREIYVYWRGAGNYHAQLREGEILVADVERSSFDGVADWIAGTCGESSGPCAGDIVLRPRGEFLSVAALMKSVLGRAEISRHPPPVRFASENSD
jgi:hypothetical protein